MTAVHDDRGEVDLSISQPIEAAVEQVALVKPIDLPFIAPTVAQGSVDTLPTTR